MFAMFAMFALRGSRQSAKCRRPNSSLNAVRVRVRAEATVKPAAMTHGHSLLLHLAVASALLLAIAHIAHRSNAHEQTETSSPYGDDDGAAAAAAADDGASDKMRSV